MKSRQLRIGLMFIAMFAFLMIVLMKFIGGGTKQAEKIIEPNKIDTVEVLVAGTGTNRGHP